MTIERVEKLVEKLERGVTKSVKFFEALDQNRWENLISDEEGAWTIRDLVGHFITSEGFLLKIAKDIASGGEGAPKSLDIDKQNQDDVEHFPRLSKSDLLSRLKETRKETIGWVRELNEITLDRQGRHPTLGISNVETVIYSIYAHQLLHMREIIPKFKVE